VHSLNFVPPMGENSAATTG